MTEENRPADPRATAGQPYPAYPTPETPPPPSRTGLLIAAGLGVLALLLGAAVYAGAHRDAPVAVTTSSTPVTTTKPPPFAVVGDCVALAGRIDPSFVKTPCAENRHNYVVTKVPETADEQCGPVTDGYVKYTKGSGVNVCLVPVFTDGECYDLSLASIVPEFPKKACGGFKVFKAKVITGTADKAACGQDENLGLALAYPEISTTYCLVNTLTYG